MVRCFLIPTSLVWKAQIPASRWRSTGQCTSTCKRQSVAAPLLVVIGNTQRMLLNRIGLTTFRARALLVGIPSAQRRSFPLLALYLCGCHWRSNGPVRCPCSLVTTLLRRCWKACTAGSWTIDTGVTCRARCGRQLLLEDCPVHMWPTHPLLPPCHAHDLLCPDGGHLPPTQVLVHGLGGDPLPPAVGGWSEARRAAACTLACSPSVGKVRRPRCAVPANHGYVRLLCPPLSLLGRLAAATQRSAGLSPPTPALVRPARRVPPGNSTKPLAVTNRAPQGTYQLTPVIIMARRCPANASLVAGKMQRVAVLCCAVLGSV